jgi:hypothetical protein
VVFFEEVQKRFKIFGYFFRHGKNEVFISTKERVGPRFGRFLNKTNPVTLAVKKARYGVADVNKGCQIYIPKHTKT